MEEKFKQLRDSVIAVPPENHDDQVCLVKYDNDDLFAEIPENGHEEQMNSINVVDSGLDVEVSGVVNEKLELVEIEDKEEIVEMGLVVEGHIDSDIKAGSEQLQVHESSFEVKITFTGMTNEIDVPVIVNSRHVYGAIEVEVLDNSVGLPDWNAYQWTPEKIIDRTHDEWFDSSRGYVIEDKNYEADRASNLGVAIEILWELLFKRGFAELDADSGLAKSFYLIFFKCCRLIYDPG